MVDQAIIPAIREAIKQHEIGNASPYGLSYARLGSSGASFGVFQGDTNVNHVARDVLRQALLRANAPADAVIRILAAVSQPCPQGNPLSDQDTALANAALDSPTGRGLVDQMDADLLQIVLGELDSCIAAAATRNLTIDPVAQLYIHPLGQYDRGPEYAEQMAFGDARGGVGPPPGPSITPQDMRSYLQANKYFQLHPQNFTHMQESLSAGAALLP
jgi:hypothetical protein